jgi:2-dehydropantoate 2-reductase
MRVLVVGAGAIGGYFGGRLLEAGRDVTFLVRPRRAAELAQTGLVIRSKLGDMNLPAPPTVTSDTLRQAFDLVILSCKAYDLDDAMTSFAPAVGPETVILPLLNGMRHLDALEARFGLPVSDLCGFGSGRPNSPPQRHPYTLVRRARPVTLHSCRGDRISAIGLPL